MATAKMGAPARGATSVCVYHATELTAEGRRTLRDDPHSITWTLMNGHPVAPRDVGIELAWDDMAEELTVTRTDPVEELWRAIELDCPGAYRLPRRGPLRTTGPGILYVKRADTAQIAAVIASSCAAAVAALAWSPGDTRPHAVFVEGSPKKLRKRSVILAEPTSPLRRGRPLRMTSLSDVRTRAPHAGGIYRIRRATTDGVGEVYIGQAVDLCRRLSTHEKVKAWGWGGATGITDIAILPARDGAVIVIDLDDAEERLIARAREREAAGGPRVANHTRGSNGRKAELTHVFILAVDLRYAPDGKEFTVLQTVTESNGLKRAPTKIAKFTLTRDLSPRQAALGRRAGQVVEATITGISDHFAYADIDGIPASIHVGQLASRYTAHPSDVVRVGERITARILTIDHATQRATLTLRETHEDPWKQFTATHREGDTVTGTITGLRDYGAFVSIASGVDGMVHISNLTDGYVAHVSDVVTTNQTVTCRILSIDAARRRVSLALVPSTDLPRQRRGGHG